MALASTVTGEGKTIAIDSNGGGTVKFMGRKMVEGVYVNGTYTAEYTESRIVKKWYALTEGAVTAYKAANHTATMSASLVNERTGAWELTVETGTGRVITGLTFEAWDPPEV